MRRGVRYCLIDPLTRDGVTDERRTVTGLLLLLRPGLEDYHSVCISWRRMGKAAAKPINKPMHVGPKELEQFRLQALTYPTRAFAFKRESNIPDNGLKRYGLCPLIKT